LQIRKEMEFIFFLGGGLSNILVSFCIRSLNGSTVKRYNFFCSFTRYIESGITCGDYGGVVRLQSLLFVISQNAL